MTTSAASGNASLTAQAVDSSGSPNVTYEWDLDGDGVFELMGPNTVELTPGPDFYPYSATVRVTDSIGRWTEALFGFTQAGNQPSGPTAGNYREKFIDATPNMPPGWKVHHTLQQYYDILAKRYWKERAINIHEPKYLRGLPQGIHSDVDQSQQAFWRQMAKSEEAWTPHNIPLEKVDEFVAKQDVEYSKLWIKSGATSDTVKDVQNYIKENATTFALDKTNRWRRMGLAVIAALPIAEVLVKHAEAVEQMQQFDPDTHIEFLRFMNSYETALAENIDIGRVKRATGENLTRDFCAFARSLRLDDEAIAKIEILLQKWTALHLHE